MFFSKERVLILYMQYLIGLLPFIDIDEDSMQIPVITSIFFKMKLAEQKTLKDKILTWI